MLEQRQTGGRRKRRLCRSLAACFLSPLLLGLVWSKAWPSQTLRVCAEPDNLPTTHRGGPRKGLYLELIDALGPQIGRAAQYVWIEGTGDRPLRLGFANDQCDVYVGLPATDGFHAPYLSLTRPFMREGYALVVHRGKKVSSLADLTGQRVAVQFGTLPQVLVALYDIEARTCDSPQEAMSVLAKGEADAAFIWGPAAGYYNKYNLRSSFDVIPTNGPGLNWPVAIGVRKDDADLRRALDRALEKVGPLIVHLQEEYGFPSGNPITIDVKEPTKASPQSSNAPLPAIASHSTARSAGLLQVSAKGHTDRDAGRLQKLAQNDQTAMDGDPPDIDEAKMSPQAREGRHLFNSRCAHCHGDDAITGNPERSIPDLLKRIPPEQEESFFVTVVTNGEADQGMPPWKGALSEDQIKKIFAFIRYLQDHRQ